MLTPSGYIKSMLYRCYLMPQHKTKHKERIECSMIDYGKQKSTVRPEELELTETKVFVSSNITEVNEDETDGQPGFTGYEFDLIEYDKDEYIKIQAEKNADLENEITQAQIAMCEIYEMMG